jgi:hypothetical protein
MGPNSKELFPLQLRRCELCTRIHGLSDPNMQKSKEANDSRPECLYVGAHRPHTLLSPTRGSDPTIYCKGLDR